MVNASGRVINPNATAPVLDLLQRNWQKRQPSVSYGQNMERNWLSVNETCDMRNVASLGEMIGEFDDQPARNVDQRP